MEVNVNTLQAAKEGLISLYSYARHHESCDAMDSREGTCDCGLNVLKDSLGFRRNGAVTAFGRRRSEPISRDQSAEPAVRSTPTTVKKFERRTKSFSTAEWFPVTEGLLRRSLPGTYPTKKIPSLMKDLAAGIEVPSGDYTYRQVEG